MNIRNEYPRPQQKRSDWFTLNGEWDFCFDDENKGLTEDYRLGVNGFDKKIIVPFAYQYKASGIGDETVHEIVWYKKKFTADSLDKNYLLCFGGVDYYCDVYVNGILVASHEGAYTEFDADITDYLNKGENLLVLRVYDPEKQDIPRGKQSWKGRFACWYTPTTGIWKSVWIERFDKDYLAERTLFTNIDDGSVYGEIQTEYRVADKLEVEVTDGENLKEKACFGVENGRARYNLSMINDNEIDKFYLWSPENPYLYGITYKIYKNGKLLDELTSRFGMRKISVEKGKICLNNRPYYQKLVLDQGYFGDGGLTALSAEQIKKSIILMKDAGFNGARKHQKIEDPYFYYYCDELGFLAWLEMPSAYSFGKTEIKAFNTQIVDIISQNSAFTSIVAYVPLNESWGVAEIVSDVKQQAFAKSLYYTIKALDQTRLVSTNDGWEGVNESDVITVHDYCRGSEGYSKKYTDTAKVGEIAPAGRRIIANGNDYTGQPLIFSEYGGIAFAKDAENGNWGYGDGAKTADELLSRIEDLTLGLKSTYYQGFCYTQLTDVQQEVNGLFDAEFNPKLDVKKLKKIFDSID